MNDTPINEEDRVPEPPPSPGPIEDAYLHRDVHPDDKAGHEHTLADSDLFPKADGTGAPEDDLWMYT